MTARRMRELGYRRQVARNGRAFWLPRRPGEPSAAPELADQDAEIELVELSGSARVQDWHFQEVKK